MKKLLLGAVTCLFMLQAQAAVVEVSNIDSGWYTKPGVHLPLIKNYYASEYGGQRNFFTFDVSAIDTSKVTNAWLTINTYDVSTIGIVSLFDVITPADVLASYHNVSDEGKAINQDLGEGLEYGSYLLTPWESNTFITINLNQDFLNDLKKSNGTISLGGTFSVGTGDPDYAFANSAFNLQNRLTFEIAAVPEAKADHLIALGLALVGIATLRKKGKFNVYRHIHY